MKHIKIKYYAVFAFLALLTVSCEKELAISEGSIVTEFFKSGDDISRIYLKPGGSDNSTGGYMDLRSGIIYTFEQMEDHYHEVDLAYTYGSTSGNNLLAMDAKNVSFSKVGEEVEHVFPYKNKGELYLYSNASSEDVSWFQALSTTADVQRGYDSLLNILTIREGNEVQPVKRLGNLKKGDIVLFHGINRKIKSLIYIENIATSANGTMNMLVKSDMGEQIYFQKPDLPLKNPALKADTLVLEVSAPNTDENYIDLFRRKVYKAEDLENDDVSQITLLHVFDGITSNFYTMTSSYIGSTYRPELWNWINTLPGRNAMHLYRIDNHAKYLPGYTFEDIRNNNEALQAYGDYIGGTGWNSRYTGSSIVPGFVMRIRNATDETQGFLKVLEVDNNTGMCKVALKYAHDE